MPPEKKVDAPSTVCSFASVSPGLDVMISVRNVSDGHGEIDALIKRILRDESIELSMPIGHIVDRDHDIDSMADACKRAGGGWCIDLPF